MQGQNSLKKPSPPFGSINAQNYTSTHLLEGTVGHAVLVDAQFRAFRVERVERGGETLRLPRVRREHERHLGACNNMEGELGFC